MRYTVFSLAIAACVLSACEASNANRMASSFRASNGFIVHPLSDGRFEVIARGASGSRGYFCAAGDYAQIRLGAPPADRVVLTQPVGPSINNPGGRSAIFTVAPQGSSRASGISLNMRQAGESLTIAHARARCRSELPGFFG